MPLGQRIPPGRAYAVGLPAHSAYSPSRGLQLGQRAISTRQSFGWRLPLTTEIQPNLGRKDFFISYATADEDDAERIATWLQAADYTLIFSKWHFKAGQDFVLQMHEAVKIAERVIVVLSEDYDKATFTGAEWGPFFRRDPKGFDGRIICVRVRTCMPPGLLAGRIFIDLVPYLTAGNCQAAATQLVEAIGATIRCQLADSRKSSPVSTSGPTLGSNNG